MQTNEQKPVEEIEVIDPIIIDNSDCVPGKVCHQKEYFEMITECTICGKLC